MISNVVLRRLFSVAMAGGVAFMLLSAAAMILYAGGTIQHHAQARYLFFENPFSDLGRTRRFDGGPNLLCMAIFVSAMVSGGIGLGSFFVGFAISQRRSRTVLVCGSVAAVLGIASGLCFVGVACTPWDLHMRAHMLFVQGAFRSLLLATLLATIGVLLSERRYRRLVTPFAMFMVLLLAYIILLTAGAHGGRWGGAVIQAVGQKMIVYSSIMMVVVQSIQMRKLSSELQSVGSSA